jgi:hypothetical protein
MAGSIAKWQLGVLVVAAALAGSSGSAGGAAVRTTSHSATLHFHAGRQTLSFRLHEPAGVIVLYRVTAPKGAQVRGFGQLRGATVPLWIATMPLGRATGCREAGPRVTCTVGEEGCPMPAGVWHFRFQKLGGPAGDVTVNFRVGSRRAR